MLTSRQRRAAGLAISVAAAFGCADQPTAPEPQPSTPALKVAPFSTDLLSPQWQEQVRALVRSNSVSPLAAGRMYAAVSVAQYRAIIAVDEHLSTEGTLPHHGFGKGGRSRYEAHRGAVSGASAQVLSFLFPAAASALEEQVETDATSSKGKGKVHPSFARGLAIGRAAGNEMIEHLQNDGSSLPFTGTIPVGPGFWIPQPGVPPGGANLGGVTPYLVNSTSQFRSLPPPAFGSPAFEADLNEVLTIAQNRTAEQVAIALFWASAGAGSTPFGYWSQVAADFIEQSSLSERAATHVFALMHAAQFDAQLTCFETKYHYFVIRPSQAEPLISLVIPLPNYPAYPSGHACLSSSAARVIEHFFPARATELANLVTEAGLSRIYAGIHYRFDIDAAWVLGRAVAEWAISHEEAVQ
jgi:membrane-associated phospholipid phosphatase